MLCSICCNSFFPALWLFNDLMIWLLAQVQLKTWVVCVCADACQIVFQASALLRAVGRGVRSELKNTCVEVEEPEACPPPPWFLLVPLRT